MPRPSSRSAAIELPRVCLPSFFPATTTHPARRSGSHHASRFCHHLHVAVMVVLFAACGIANARPVAAAQSAATSNRDRIDRFVAEAALRFGIPASWIKAVMHAESRGTVRAVSLKGAMGLMQIMPQTWAELRSRYGLGTDPFDPRDNILAGTAYLRELHDRYGAAGFLAAYNAGPGRYEDHLASGRRLPLETQAYIAALAPLPPDDGPSSRNVVTAIIRSWTSSPLFPARANDVSSVGAASFDDLGRRRSMPRPASDWTGLVPQSEGLFAHLSAREPRL
jgi:Transglycosylase SLT domain